MHATAIDHVNLRYPPDQLDEVIDFYVDTLGFETRFEDPHAAVEDDPGLFPILLGDDCRIYVNPTAEFDPEANNYRHVAIRILEAPEDLRERFEHEGIEVDHEAERERDSVGAYTSFYVPDPIGYTVEFMAVGE